MTPSFWKPVPLWKGEDVYIIGGGSSLKSFDWELLRGRKTLGCNAAFYLGVDYCKAMVFGDTKFWERDAQRRKDIEQYVRQGGMVFTNTPALYCHHPDWMFVLPRRSRGMYGDTLGWNLSTGATAINLALILGAKNIFLLGYDMAATGHWHNHYKTHSKEEVYQKFLRGFDYVKKDLAKWPDAHVWNLGGQHTALPHFPIGTIEDHFGRTEEKGNEEACCGGTGSPAVGRLRDERQPAIQDCR